LYDWPLRCACHFRESQPADAKGVGFERQEAEAKMPVQLASTKQFLFLSALHPLPLSPPPPPPPSPSYPLHIPSLRLPCTGGCPTTPPVRLGPPGLGSRSRAGLGLWRRRVCMGSIGATVNMR
jgi:hypothetical protein